MFNLTGRVAVITGASSGLGRQMSIAFAKQGADVVVMARRVQKLEEVRKQIEEMGRKCLAIECDVTNVEDIDHAASQVEDVFGKCDILVNCAGSAKNNGVLDMTDEEWQFTMDTDLSSVFYVTRAFGNLMKKKNYGRIINIASLSGLKGLPGQCNYSAAKGGLIASTKALAQEIGKKGVTVNAIAPGFIKTDMVEGLDEAELIKTIPAGRFGNPEEVAALVAFLASPEAGYITGECISINGGLYS